MRYAGFSVANFKGIGHADLKLGGDSPTRVHTLVGLNESGKTTVLEAIDLFGVPDEDLNPSELSGRIRPDEHELIPVAKRLNFNGTISITAVVVPDDDDIAALKKVVRQHGGMHLISVGKEIEIEDRYFFVNSKFDRKQTFWPSPLGKVRYRTGYVEYDLRASNFPSVWNACVKEIRHRTPAIWYFPNFLFDFPSRIYLRAQPEDRAAERFYRAVLQDILQAVDPDMTIEEHLLARYESGAASERKALASVLLNMSRRLTNDVFDAWRSIFQRDIQMKLKFEIDDSATSLSESEPYIQVQIEANDGYYLVEERSLGFRWFFVYLMLTHYRGLQQRGEAKEILYLLDEPASNLHSSAQAQLLQSFLNLSARGARVLYTTHSHHMINPDWLEQTFIVRNRAMEAASDEIELTARETDIEVVPYREFVSQHPDQSRFFQPILDVLDYAPSRLEMVPSIVLVEGKNDYYTLRLACQLIGISPSEIALYPGGGAGSLDQVIALYTAWGRKIVVLLDSDSEGQSQRNRYIERFGSYLHGRIYLLSDLEPTFSGKALDSVFTKADKDTFLRAFGTGSRTPDKKVLHRLLQQAVASERAVNLEKTTVESLRKLIEGLVSSLAAQ
jgi:5S rRNA maturation endonuclease (ribonuclease M5)